jgi:hypothetical protein
VKARQSLFRPLRRLKEFCMGPQILKMFYSCTIESITALYGNSTALDYMARQEGGADSPVHHLGRAASNPGPLYQAV